MLGDFSRVRAALMRGIFVAGGAGFIGSNFIRHVMRERPDTTVVNFDALTYAGNLENLADVADDSRYPSCTATSPTPLPSPRRCAGCDAVVNFAAESHVDRSIEDAADFIETNVRGVYNVLAVGARPRRRARAAHLDRRGLRPGDAGEPAARR